MKGADIITLGFIGTNGLRTVSTAGAAFGQVVQLLPGGQCTFMVALPLMLKLSFGRTQELPAT
jgi:hypothetical protein